MKYAMGLTLLVGIGLIVGGVLTALHGGPGEENLEYHFSGTVGAVGGLVMVVTVLLLPLTRQKPPPS